MNVTVKLNHNEVIAYANEHKISESKAYKELMLQKINDQYDSHMEEEMIMSASFSTISTARI